MLSKHFYTINVVVKDYKLSDWFVYRGHWQEVTSTTIVGALATF